MKNRNLRYLTREGIKNIGANRLMSLASVTVLMSCLVMIGCAVLLYLNIDSLVKNIESQNVIMVFVNKRATDEEENAVEASLHSVGNIKSVKKISREEAFGSIQESLGENAKFLEDNDVDASFLPVSFEVEVDDMQFFPETVSKIRGIENVLHVRENSDLAVRLEKIRTAVTYVCLGIIALLFLVALFIIANTIRITMYTRRKEISIMKAVGATNSFIRWPFLIEGVTIGLISAALGLGVLYGIYYFAGDALLTIFGILDGKLVEFKDYVLQIAAGFVAVSIVTAGIGSIFSIGKYLREQGSVVDANS